MGFFYRLLFAIEKRLEFERNKRNVGLLKSCGSEVLIHPTCHILNPEQLEIGDNTSISSYTTIYAARGIKIGNNCLISSNCGISSISHIQNSLNRRDYDADNMQFSKPVSIGNNVWIGMNACILPGVTIGDNSIIGAGCVVTKNVSANEIWVGNPGRCVRKLTF